MSGKFATFRRYDNLKPCNIKLSELEDYSTYNNFTFSDFTVNVDLSYNYIEKNMV